MDKKRAYKLISRAYRAYFRERGLLGFSSEVTQKALGLALSVTREEFSENQLLDLKELTESNVERGFGDEIEHIHWLNLVNKGIIF
jgi:hypothetical protein